MHNFSAMKVWLGLTIMLVLSVKRTIPGTVPPSGGQEGPVGPTGSTGSTGEIGPVGCTGAPGVPGAPGATGNTGYTGGTGPYNPCYTTTTSTTTTTTKPPPPQQISHCDLKYCYQLSAQTMYYPDVYDPRSTCRFLNNASWPLEIYDEGVMGSVQFIMNYYSTVLNRMKIYFGLEKREQSQWTWNDGSLFAGFPTKQQTTTNDTRKKFIFVSMTTTSGQSAIEFYEDYSTNPRYYVCQYNRSCDTFARGWPGKGPDPGTNCYVAYNTYSLSWHDARYKCKQGGGNLGVFGGYSSDEVLEGMAKMGATSGTFWVGACSVRWYWNHLAGAEAVYTNWVYHAGFPNSNLFSPYTSPSDFYIGYIEVNVDNNQWKDTVQGYSQYNKVNLTLICMSMNPSYVEPVTTTTKYLPDVRTTDDNLLQRANITPGGVVGVVVGLSIFCAVVGAVVAGLLVRYHYRHRNIPHVKFLPPVYEPSVLPPPNVDATVMYDDVVDPVKIAKVNSYEKPELNKGKLNDDNDTYDIIA